MALKYLVDLNLGGNEIQNVALQTLSTAQEPSTNVLGQIYYNTTENAVFANNGSGFVRVGLTADGSTIIDSSGTISVGTIAISNVSGLQTALNDKVDDSQVLTNVPSGAVFTDTQRSNEEIQDVVDGLLSGGNGITLTYNDSANTLTIDGTTYSAGNGISLSGTTFSVAGGDGLTQGASGLSVDSTVVRTSGAQTIGGDKTFSNNVIVSGDLTVSGTTTTVNSTAITLADNIITLASNAASPAEVVEAGIEINRGDGQSKPTITYFEADQRWKWSIDGGQYYVLPMDDEFNTNTQRSDEDIRDVVAAQVVGGTNVTVTENDGANTLTISSVNTQRSDEEIRDLVADVVVTNGSHTGITASDDDTGNGVDLATTFHTKSITVAGEPTPISLDLVSNGFTAPCSIQVYEQSGENRIMILTDIQQNVGTNIATISLADGISYTLVISGLRG